MDNVEFAQARKTMVDCQIRPTKVTDERVIEAFGEVPREAFVGRHQRAIAYIDERRHSCAYRRFCYRG